MSHPARLEYVSANDLLTGEVVFLASDGRWVQDLGGAMFFADPDEGALRLIQAGADAGRVVGPCLADAAQDGAQVPVHLRERVRATGPSNDYHGQQVRAAHV